MIQLSACDLKQKGIDVVEGKVAVLNCNLQHHSIDETDKNVHDPSRRGRGGKAALTYAQVYSFLEGLSPDIGGFSRE